MTESTDRQALRHVLELIEDCGIDRVTEIRRFVEEELAKPYVEIPSINDPLPMEPT